MQKMLEQMKLSHRDDFSCPNNIFDICLFYVIAPRKVKYFLEMMNLKHPVISLLPEKCRKGKGKYKKSFKSSFLFIIWGADFQPFSQS